MTVESKFVDKPGEEKREETLKLIDIDTDYLERLIDDDIENFKDTHRDYFDERQDWLLGMRDLRYQYKEGYFDNASDLHVPYTLTMAKAMHARIFQVFSAKNIFSVEARNAGYIGREETVNNFMNWTLSKWINRGQGFKAITDHWLGDLVEDGSATLKLTWDTWEDTFVDFDITTEETEAEPSLFADAESVEVEDASPEITAKVTNTKKTVVKSGPRVGTISNDDLFMPPGQTDVQSSPWIAHRVILKDDDLKLRVKQGKFDKDIVEKALELRSQPLRDEFGNGSGGRGTGNRRDMARLEGVNVENGKRSDKKTIQSHTIYEWYGRAYVDKEVTDDTFENIKDLPQEIVVWYHAELRKILGWTYLHRISPSGRRPFYKADFIPSKERAFGIGVGELLWSINNHMDGVHNIKMDNGVLSSMQFGYYRAGSSFKPDTFKLRPGDLIPVEDVNDVKMQSVPYLGSFGEAEEATLGGYGARMLAINDINLGNVSGAGVAGALRNATGANFIDRQANIQLNPHLDRIARTMDQFFSDLFILTRSRMEGELFFRVTGEDGKAIFGEITKEDLAGEFDFSIDTNVAAASEQERQQRASLMLQTILNPTFMQMGIVQPGNLYEVMKEFLIRHQVKNPDAFITRPPDYTGPPLTPGERILKILMGQGDNPPIENTVKPEEDHETALAAYEQFQESEQFGILTGTQLAAFKSLTDEHQKFMDAAGNAVGLPNIAGTQFSNEGGLPALGGETGVPDAGAAEGGPLGSPLGEPNGPVQ